jgi:tetratricopeptide (TPR) repeat protein
MAVSGAGRVTKSPALAWLDAGRARRFPLRLPAARVSAKIQIASFKLDRHSVEDIRVRLWKHVRDAIEIQKLRRREDADDSPRTAVRLCRLLEDRGRNAEAIQTAREGLDRFPHAHELADVLRRGFARAGAGSSELRDVIRAYLDHAMLDEAASGARELLRKFPSDPQARLLHGQACLALFGRDHASQTGAEALESLRRATELDPESLDARRSLAEAHHAIGATSQALFHVLLALEMDPHDPGSNRLYAQLQGLPFQRRTEKALLWEAEINDQPLVQKQTKPRDRDFGDRVRDGVRRLSGTRGVRRVALRHHGVAIVASNGDDARPATAATNAFLASAEHLRRAGSAWSKRIGMGGFEEATLVIGEATVFAVAAAGSVLAIEVEQEDDLHDVADEARNLLASWTSARYRDLEWVR